MVELAGQGTSTFSLASNLPVLSASSLPIDTLRSIVSYCSFEDTRLRYARRNAIPPCAELPRLAELPPWAAHDLRLCAYERRERSGLIPLPDIS